MEHYTANKGKYMAGRKIDDHAGFFGKGGEYPLPTGNKMKRFHSAEGDGHVGSDYPDTSEAIHKNQMASNKESKKQSIRDNKRY